LLVARQSIDFGDGYHGIDRPARRRAVIRLGYKASAEQLAPGKLRDFSCLADGSESAARASPSDVDVALAASSSSER
jgi:hypothetical protein